MLGVPPTIWHSMGILVHNALSIQKTNQNIKMLMIMYKETSTCRWVYCMADKRLGLVAGSPLVRL